jgi:hypothetical protein
MSDMDDKLRSAYARLPREEPSASLDAAILDASRRAIAPRRSTQRWAVPLSIAAVLVLAFGIAIHRDEYPTSLDESRMAAPQAPPPAVQPQAPPVAQAPQEAAPAAKHDAAPEVRAKKPANTAALRDERAREEARPRAQAKPERKDQPFAPEPQGTAQTLQKETANVAPITAAPMQAPAPAAAAAPAAPPAPARAAMPMATTPAPQSSAGAAALAPREADALRAQSRMKVEAARPAPASAADIQAPDDITRELDAIAKLRTEHRDDEADKALEAFRRKHPDYRIPDAVWERVRPR